MTNFTKVATEIVDAMGYDTGRMTALVESLSRYLEVQFKPEPVKMILHCPQCHAQHIDAPEVCPVTVAGEIVDSTETWGNPPHRSHLCGHCGHIWRPADVPTEIDPARMPKILNYDRSTEKKTIRTIWPDGKVVDYVREAPACLRWPYE